MGAIFVFSFLLFTKECEHNSFSADITNENMV